MNRCICNVIRSDRPLFSHVFTFSLFSSPVHHCYLPAFIFCADRFLLFHFLSDHILPSVSLLSCWPLSHFSSSVYPLHSSSLSASIWQSHQCLSVFCLSFWTYFICVCLSTPLYPLIHWLLMAFSFYYYSHSLKINLCSQVTRVDIFHKFVSGSGSFFPPLNH